MYSSNHGKFENRLEGKILISEYSGSFNEKGIKAIFNDVIAMGSKLNVWVWHQKPHPECGITPEGIQEMINRYTTMHLHCSAIGVSYSNVLVNAVKLPEDGSIKIPFKVSRSEVELNRFFDDAIAKAELALKNPNQYSIATFAKNTQVISEFITAMKDAKLDENIIKTLTGRTTQQLKDVEHNLDPEVLTHIQALTAFVGIVAFKLKSEVSVSDWLTSEFAQMNNQTPLAVMRQKEGLHQLIQHIADH